MTSDEEQLEAALHGDEAAFTALYRRRQGAVYRFALHMSGDAAVSEDVTQEVFMALFESGRRFDARRWPHFYMALRGICCCGVSKRSVPRIRTHWRMS